MKIKIISITLLLCCSIMVGNSAFAATTNITGTSQQTISTDVHIESSSSEFPTRIAGMERYDTAVEIAKQGWGKTGAKNVVLAYGGSNEACLAEAIASGPLANVLKAPILLTDGKTLSQATVQEIKDLGATTIYVTSRNSIIEQTVLDQLTGLTVKPVWGNDSPSTSIEIAKTIATLSGKKMDTFALANGTVGSPDVLSIASIASAKQFPILITDNNASLPKAVKDYLATLSITKSYVVGGTAVISDNQKSELVSPIRLAGQDRYDTNAAVIRAFSEDNSINPDHVFVANGSSLVDAISGVTLAANFMSAIILTDGVDATDFATAKGSLNNSNGLFTALGGSSVVPESATGYNSELKANIIDVKGATKESVIVLANNAANRITSEQNELLSRWATHETLTNYAEVEEFLVEVNADFLMLAIGSYSGNYGQLGDSIKSEFLKMPLEKANAIKDEYINITLYKQLSKANNLYDKAFDLSIHGINDYQTAIGVLDFYYQARMYATPVYNVLDKIDGVNRTIIDFIMDPMKQYISMIVPSGIDYFKKVDTAYQALELLEIGIKAFEDSNVGIEYINDLKDEKDQYQKYADQFFHLDNNIVSNPDLGIPNLNSPQDGYSTVVGQSITLQWSNTSATKYRLRVLNDSGDVFFDFDSVVNSYYFTPTTTGHWTWQVQSYLSTGQLGSSTQSRGFIVIEKPPTVTVPQTLSVTNKDINNISLSWGQVNPSFTYHVQMSRYSNSDFSEVAIAKQSNITISNLVPATTYYFRVAAEQSGIWSAYTDSVSGRTADVIYPPEKPLLIAPTEWASCQSAAPTLIWSGPFDTSRYQYQVTLYDNSPVNYSSPWITDQSWRPSEADGKPGNYTWQVACIDKISGKVSTSDPRHFTIVKADSTDLRLDIRRALYGAGNNIIDVTQKVRSLVSSDTSLSIDANNSLCGYDPIPNTAKTLTIIYRNRWNEEYQTSVSENGKIIITSDSRVGTFLLDGDN